MRGLALAALLLISSAVAQPTFDDDRIFRLGYGDIPTTETVERSAWNLHETRILPGSFAAVSFELPPGHVLGGVDCTCDETHAETNGVVDVTWTPVEGNVTVSMWSWTGSAPSDVGGTMMDAPDRSVAMSFKTGTARLIMYVPDDMQVVASLPLSPPLPSTAEHPGFHIYTTSVNRAFWIAITEPAAIAPAPGFAYLELALGVAAGIVVWAFLVQRGIVQKRQRKQVAAVAEHKQVASSESKHVLEGRKRVLMAGLKDLEVAKMHKQMDPAVYDQLKAELKRETVTVMRALEEAKA